METMTHNYFHKAAESEKKYMKWEKCLKEVKCIQMLDDMLKSCPQMRGRKNKLKLECQVGMFPLDSAVSFNLWIYLMSSEDIFPLQKYGEIAKVKQLKIQTHVHKNKTQSSCRSEAHNHLSKANL